MSDLVNNQPKKFKLDARKPVTIVPIVGSTRSDILSQARRINQTECGLVEWRLDYYDQASDRESVKELIWDLAERLRQPLLVTLRSQAEGGQFPLTPGDYQAIISHVIQTGACQAVDIEYQQLAHLDQDLISLAHQAGVQVVLSNHDFHQTPDQVEMVDRLLAMAQTAAVICKLAVMPQTPGDVLALLNATYQASQTVDKALITMAMGDLGLVSRLAGHLFGSAASFASLGQASAPGQIDLADLTAVLNLLKKH
ncbi:hypothetical protein AWM75_03115 [Aerococcus urinaehominis]|uniref:3-dehydroquinate dehydratase n=1 Tax=Aerococcus urinaehominis TaxID=128944 RepID=A0A109RGW8_9LACT|nr:type I 3-dehydroquinate dehydratase [Aerococcus urinaehominis]AMB99051.1 hypothetical protein AWM75_03115 [Aerococcus urinaehominis]SDM50385.1 3-dehydroquinate dehydratase [Aerococcus urinaehominis]